MFQNEGKDKPWMQVVTCSYTRACAITTAAKVGKTGPLCSMQLCVTERKRIQKDMGTQQLLPFFESFFHNADPYAAAAAPPSPPPPPVPPWSPTCTCSVRVRYVCGTVRRATEHSDGGLRVWFAEKRWGLQASLRFPSLFVFLFSFLNEGGGGFETVVCYRPCMLTC